MRVPQHCLLIALATAAIGCASAEPEAARQPISSDVAPRAVSGERVMVIINHVKPDRRDEFESFVRDFLVPGVKRLGETDPLAVQAHSRTRVIMPTRQNPDGTYTYLFLMDPVVAGFSYDFEDLKAVYPAAEVDRRSAEFFDSLAEEQVHIIGTVAPTDVW